uniref:Uncharacterized protein n=1 Tax=viral metagenome TaxID=1070528 RepID=A0A6H1ZPT0_9ZZZZ
MVQKKPAQLIAKKKVNFTDVQVRIHNKAYNFKQAIVVSIKDLFPYIDKIRKEAKDAHGRPNWQKFDYLPLIAFVDPDEKEEVVFQKEKDLPSEPTEIKTKSGTLIAKITE